MPGYKPLKTEYFDESCNLLIRLNREDTITLQRRLDEILPKEGGVNFILLNMKGAISITESDERGRQLKFIAFSDKVTFSPETEQKGYTGNWSHIEISIPFQNGVDVIRKFINKWKEPKKVEAELDKWTTDLDSNPRTGSSGGNRPCEEVRS